MSVSYSRCDKCKESIYDEYVGSCDSCGNNLCTNCLINDNVNSRYAHKYGLVFTEGLKGEDFYDKNGRPYYEVGDIVDDTNIQEKYCPFCSGKEIDREALFDHLIWKLNIDINKEWAKYKNKTIKK